MHQISGARLLYAFALLVTLNGLVLFSFSVNGRPRVTQQLRVVATNKRDSGSAERKGSGPFMGASLRGYVKKQGIVPPVYYLNATANVREEAFMQWLDSYTNGNAPSHPPLPFPNCQVYVNHHYKFIWLRGYKVASSTIRGRLGYMCDMLYNVPPEANLSACSVGLHVGQNFTVQDVERWWKEYFVFGVVRNPYTRFASAEEYIGSIVDKHCSKPAFSDICRDPFLDVKLYWSRQCPYRDWFSHHYKHFADQTRCLFTDTLEPAADFIAEVENLEEDFAIIVDEINKRRDPKYPPLETGPLVSKNTHSSESKPTNEYAYELYKANQTCLHSIVRFFNRDFQLLGYERLETLP